MKVIAVVYDDPFKEHPKTYMRNSFPKIKRLPHVETLPTLKKLDFKPGQLLASVSDKLELRKFLEDLGHRLVVTSNKDELNTFLKKKCSKQILLSLNQFDACEQY